jgi:endo-1,4-beta-xylanase
MLIPNVLFVARSTAQLSAAAALVAGFALARCTSKDNGTPTSDSAPPAEMDGSSTSAADATSDAPACGQRVVPANFHWTSSDVLLSPQSDATHSLAAIKDPSVVYYNNAWHVFMSTVSTTGSYSMAYATFADWSQASSAPLQYLDSNPRLLGYHAAPQVFYFRPENRWYLIFQSGPPQYSTNTDIANVAGWTTPANFFAAEPAVVAENKGDAAYAGWLDFWAICDTKNCFLFFSDDNGTWYRSQTAIADFPNGFGNTVVVMKDPSVFGLYEASNVYLMQDTGKYLGIVEAFGPTSNYHRYFRSWTADALDGEWTPLQDTFAMPFAATSNVTFSVTPWTADISHGEMVRAGFDETLTIDTCQLQYLYQGYAVGAPTDPYNDIPWKLGLLTQTN